MSTARTTTSTSVPVSNLVTMKRVMALMIVGLGLIRLNPAIGTESFHNDFSHYYVGGSIYASGESAYQTPLKPLMAENGLPYCSFIPYAAHPPLLLLLLSALSWLPMKAAYYAWLIVQFVAAGCSIEMARRILKRRWSDPMWLLLVGLLLNSISFQMLIYYSQVQLIIGAAVYSAYWLGTNRRHCLACAAITLASAFKIYPVVLAPWIFFRDLNGWKDAAQRLLAMAGTSVICLTVPGLHNWVDFVTNGVPVLAGNAVKWCNYSLQNFWPMLGNVMPSTASFAHFAAPLSALLAIAAAYVCAFRLRGSPIKAFSILLVAMMFSGVITWSHYLTVLFLPICYVLLRESDASHSRNPARTVLAIISAFALMMPKLDSVFLNVQGTVPDLLLHFYPLYAGIAICVVLALPDKPSSQGNLAA